MGCHTQARAAGGGGANTPRVRELAHFRVQIGTRSGASTRSDGCLDRQAHVSADCVARSEFSSGGPRSQHHCCLRRLSTNQDEPEPECRSGRVGRARSRSLQAPAPPGEGATPTTDPALLLSMLSGRDLAAATAQGRCCLRTTAATPKEGSAVAASSPERPYLRRFFSGCSEPTKQKLIAYQSAARSSGSRQRQRRSVGQGARRSWSGYSRSRGNGDRN